MIPSPPQIVELGPDDDRFIDWCEVWAAGERADRPDEPPRPVSDHVALGRQLVTSGGSRDGTHRAAVVDGAVVGALRLILPVLDNLTVAIVDVAVHPAHRRRGIGSTLLAEGARLAEAHGRTELISEVDEPGPDARRPGLRSPARLDVRPAGDPPRPAPAPRRGPAVGAGGRGARRERRTTRSSPGATAPRTNSSTTAPCWSGG